MIDTLLNLELHYRSILGLSGGDNIDKYKLIIKLDLYYIRNKSFSLNCKIIIKTIKTILKF